MESGSNFVRVQAVVFDGRADGVRVGKQTGVFGAPLFTPSQLFIAPPERVALVRVGG